MIVTATIDGYAIHAKANSTFVEEWGGLGTPDVREVSQPAPRRHGALVATSLFGPRVMPVRGWCGKVPGGSGGEAAAVAAFDTLKAKLWPETSHALVIRRPGRAADEQLTVRLASDVSANVEAGGQVIRWGFELVAPDPLLYGTTLNVQAGTANTGTTIPTVGGTVPTPAILQVRGPTVAGTLTLTNAAGQAVSLTSVPVLAAYSAGNPATFFDVYLGDREVDYQGVTRPSWVVAASTTWWRLPVGSSVTVTMGGTARASGTRLAVYWREARI